MVTFASYFWPAIWSAIGVGAAVTVALCLVVAMVPGPHAGFRIHHGSALRPRRHGPRLGHHAWA
jgi:hypothetical protein